MASVASLRKNMLQQWSVSCASSVVLVDVDQKEGVKRRLEGTASQLLIFHLPPEPRGIMGDGFRQLHNVHRQYNLVHTCKSYKD